MSSCWLIEVVYGPDDSRSPRYFDGSCAPFWDGNATLDPFKAVRYATKEAAERDIAKLFPRKLGKWQAIEHGFHDDSAPSPADAG